MRQKSDKTSSDRSATTNQQLTDIITLHLSPIYNFGMKMCRNHHDAEDITQETMLAAARGINDFRGEASVTTWLFTIARRACLRRRRLRKDEPAHVLSLTDPLLASASASASTKNLKDDQITPADELIIQKEAKTILQKALALLDYPHREIIILRDLQGLSAIEVAQILGLSITAVKSRLHRARMALRQKLSNYIEDTVAMAKSPKCPAILRNFSHRLDGEVDAKICATIETHLANCPDCKKVCAKLQQMLKLCRNYREEPVPKALQQKIRDNVMQAILK